MRAVPVTGARLQIERAMSGRGVCRVRQCVCVCVCACVCVHVLCELCAKGPKQVEGAVMALIALTTAPSQSVKSLGANDQRIGGVGGSRKPLRERRRSCAWMRPERRDGVLHKLLCAARAQKRWVAPSVSALHRRRLRRELRRHQLSLLQQRAWEPRRRPRLPR